MQLICNKGILNAVKSINDRFHRHTLDKAGIFVSVLCLIHCIALPVALPLLQMIGLQASLNVSTNETLHLILAFLLLGIGGFAFFIGYIRHRAIMPLLLGVFGTSLLFVGALNPRLLLSESESHALTIFATFVLIFAHWKNRKEGAECKTAH
jgi:hypothetical protein